MTIKELAETAGCNEKTVRRIGKELFPNSFARGRKTSFNKEQCFDIMSKLPKRNIVQMSEQERTNVRTNLNDQDIKLISSIVSMTVAETMKALDSRVSSIESKVQKRQALLPATKSTRNSLRQLVNSYSRKHDIRHGDAWRELYQECYYTLNINFSKRASNVNMKPIDYIEANGYLEQVESVMLGMLEK